MQSHKSHNSLTLEETHAINHYHETIIFFLFFLVGYLFYVRHFIKEVYSTSKFDLNLFLRDFFSSFKCDLFQRHDYIPRLVIESKDTNVIRILNPLFRIIKTPDPDPGSKKT